MSNRDNDDDGEFTTASLEHPVTTLHHQHPQHQHPHAGHPHPHQAQALNYSARGMVQLPNFSARGMVQLPHMFASQPLSVGTYASQPLSVPTDPEPVGSSSAVAAVRNAAQPIQVSNVVGNAVAQPLGIGHPQHAQHVQQQQLPFQVASLAKPQPQHGQHLSAAPTLPGLGNINAISSSAASLMSQIALQPQHQQQVQQAQQQVNELFPAFPLNSSNPWDATTTAASVASLGFSSQATLPQAPIMPATIPQPPPLGHMAITGTLGSSQAVAAVASAASSAMQAPQAIAVASMPGSNINPPKMPSTKHSATTVSNNKSQKRKRPTKATPATSANLLATRPPVSDAQSERIKRRNERNAREQERSQQITKRIGELRTVLSSAGVAFKADRYNTLVSVGEYIKQLQGKSEKLDEEHKRLLDTISGADRLVNSAGGIGTVGTTTVHQTHHGMENTTSSNSSSSDTHSNTDDEFLVFVQGIDYKSVFASCGLALAIASVDGRFVDCNEEFLRITEYSRIELLGEENEGGRTRKSLLPHPQGSSGVPSAGGGKVDTATSALTTSAESKAVKTPDLHASSGNLKPPPSNRNGGPPSEIHMRKQHHLSLFNLLGGEDMEAVYAAMSRMLRAPEHHSSSQMSQPFFTGLSRDLHNITSSSGMSSSGKQTSTDDGGGTSSSSGDSCVKSDLTRSTEDNSSSGNEVMNEGEIMMGDGGVEGVGDGEHSGGSGGDHWTGRVKNAKRKDQQMLQLNISLVRTADGRPKFFNCALSEVE